MWNDKYSEFNDLKLNNDTNYEQYNYNELTNNLNNLENDQIVNSERQQSDYKYKHKNFNWFKISSSFIMICAIIVILQPNIQIPVFSQIFGPLINISHTVNANCTFSDFKITYKDVGFTLTIDNVDNFSTNKFDVFIVEKGCNNDAFVSAIPLSSLSSIKITVTKQITSAMLNQYIGTGGTNLLAPDTQYVLLVVKENKIIKSQIINTDKFDYLLNIDIKKNSSYILFTPTTNTAFTSYTYLYFEFYDSITNTFLTYSNAYKGSSPNISNVEFGLSKTIDIKVYCLPTSSINIGAVETKTIDENLYYLIYTKNNIDITPYF